MIWQELRYFKKSEWRNNPDVVSISLLKKIDDLRHEYGKPIIIHEAWAEQGHSLHSAHYSIPCTAVDFHFKDSNYKKQFELIKKYGFSGIGFYPFWNNKGWHVDLRNDYKLMWVRGASGQYFYGCETIERYLND